MKTLLGLLFSFIYLTSLAQTTLTEAADFHVKTIDGETIYLFPILDNNQQIVVIDFFSTSCGPCQDYAPDFQACYENFGANQGNVYFMGLNWGNDNTGVREFDSIFGLTYPSVSGNQGGANIVYNQYNILSYPTVIVITPDHQIVEQYIWVPDEENITQAILNAGGLMVSTDETENNIESPIEVFPQPAHDMLHVKLNTNQNQSKTIKLFQPSGKLIFSENYAANAYSSEVINLDTKALKSGFYILQVIVNNKMVATQKVIIH